MRLLQCGSPHLPTIRDRSLGNASDPPGNVFIPDVTGYRLNLIMADPKHRSTPPAQPDTEPKAERRRLSRIVHDHKGNATVQWYDAPADYERPVFEIEGAKGPSAPHERGLSTGSLAIEAEDSHNPYMRDPEADRKRDSGTRTDLRKLSAWIKLMRSLEEARKRKDEDDE